MLHDACILAVFWYFQESLQMSLSLMPPNALVGLITFGKMVSDTAKHPPITGISVDNSLDYRDNYTFLTSKIQPPSKYQYGHLALSLYLLLGC